METNYYGVKSVTSALVPLLRASPHGARIVFFSTRMALYNRLPSGEARKLLQNEVGYSEDVANALASKYLEDMKAGTAAKEGWLPDEEGKMAVYSESKMFLNVYTVALAKSFEKSQPEGHRIFVAGTCPGVTLTDLMKEAMANGFEPSEAFPVKTPAEGADTAVWLALLPESEWQGKPGKFFGERTEYPFGWENPEW